jgi:phosphoesterase RecJ-like protein
MAEGITQDRLDRLDRLVTAARNVVIAVHTHPDGDAVGSAVGLGVFLRERRCCDVTLLFPDPAPALFGFLTDGERVLTATVQGEESRTRVASADLIFCLDCNGFSRTASLEKPLQGAPCPKILIDHHLRPESDRFDLVFSDPSASSASELVFHLLKGLGGTPLPGKAATALMTGMTTDTNNFANSATPSTFRMAADLLDEGVDREAILQLVYRQYDERRLRLLAHCLQSMVITPECAAYMILDRATQQDFGVEEGDTEGFVNEPLAIGRVRMSLFLKEEDGLFRVSIRSKRGTSAQRLAADRFHGGGHELAAGGKLFYPQDIPSPADAAAFLESVLSGYLRGTISAKETTATF